MPTVVSIMPTPMTQYRATVTILKLKDGKVIDTALFSNSVKYASLDYNGKRTTITTNGVHVVDTSISSRSLYIVFTDTRPTEVPLDSDYNYDITIRMPNSTAVIIVNDGVVNVGVTTP